MIIDPMSACEYCVRDFRNVLLTLSADITLHAIKVINSTNQPIKTVRELTCWIMTCRSLLKNHNTFTAIIMNQRAKMQSVNATTSCIMGKETKLFSLMYMCKYNEIFNLVPTFLNSGKNILHETTANNKMPF